MVSERQETVPGIFEGQFQHFAYFDYHDHIHDHIQKTLSVAV